NGIVTVHLGVTRGRFKGLIDAELYLPQSWAEDRPRCREAGIPDDMVYRPKWQIALEEIDRAQANGVRLDWLTFDEEYGKRPGFVAGLDGRQLRFVGEVPRNCSCLAAHRSGGGPPSGPTAGPRKRWSRPAARFWASAGRCCGWRGRRSRTRCGG